MNVSRPLSATFVNGIAVLAFDGDGPQPEELAEEARLMRELVTFRP
jgi:hypothetical protein